MRNHTARKIVSDPIGEVARNVAKASGKSLDRVVNEAKKLLVSIRKRERRRRRNAK